MPGSVSGLLVAAALAPVLWRGECRLPPARRTGADEILAAACQETARYWQRDLGRSCRAIVKPPLVIAGDLGEAGLREKYRGTIGPAMRAMAATYFRAPPGEPITVLLFADEESYRRHAKSLLGEENVSKCGYYRPHLRTVIVDAGAGDRALRHELTHALMAFDFPDAPTWLAEGLAALHEECSIPDNPPRIIGMANQRLPVLAQALRQGRLRPLKSLLEADDFHGRDAPLNYAHARYFCLYLQQQDALGDFYRRFRANHAQDPRGTRLVREQFPGRTWKELDADFRQFLSRLTMSSE